MFDDFLKVHKICVDEVVSSHIFSKEFELTLSNFGYLSKNQLSSSEDVEQIKLFWTYFCDLLPQDFDFETTPFDLIFDILSFSTESDSIC